MNGDEWEEHLEAGTDRLVDAIHEAQRLGQEYGAALLAVAQVRAEVEEETGINLGEAMPLYTAARYEDLRLEDVAELRRRCAAAEEAAGLVVPLLQAAPGRTVGAVLKTCDLGVAVRVREAFVTSMFFPE